MPESPSGRRAMADFEVGERLEAWYADDEAWYDVEITCDNGDGARSELQCGLLQRGAFETTRA